MLLIAKIITLEVSAYDLKILYVGFMRLMTMNLKKFCKDTELGWRRT